MYYNQVLSISRTGIIWERSCWARGAFVVAIRISNEMMFSRAAIEAFAEEKAALLWVSDLGN